MFSVLLTSLKVRVLYEKAYCFFVMLCVFYLLLLIFWGS